MAKEVEEPPVNMPQTTVKSEDPPASYSSVSKFNQIRITPCDKQGVVIDPNEFIVAFLTAGDQNIDNQYSTPFENSNPEHRLPTLMGQLQSGGWVDTLNSILNALPLDSVASSLPLVGRLKPEQKASLSQLEGRSSLTKVNSTQIFTSTQPITLNLTLFFDTWKDAVSEVEGQLLIGCSVQWQSQLVVMNFSPLIYRPILNLQEI